MSLTKLFLLSVWVTLVVWFIVEKLQQQEYVVAPTIVVTPQTGE